MSDDFEITRFSTPPPNDDVEIIVFTPTPESTIKNQRQVQFIINGFPISKKNI